MRRMPALLRRLRGAWLVRVPRRASAACATGLMHAGNEIAVHDRNRNAAPITAGHAGIRMTTRKPAIASRQPGRNCSANFSPRPTRMTVASSPTILRRRPKKSRTRWRCAAAGTLACCRVAA